MCTAQVAAKQMVGVYLSIWVRQSLLPHVHGTQVTSVGTGVLGYLGNKGGHCSMLCRSACWHSTFPSALHRCATGVPHGVQAPLGRLTTGHLFFATSLCSRTRLTVCSLISKPSMS